MVKKLSPLIIICLVIACNSTKQIQKDFNPITELLLNCRFIPDSASIGDSISVMLTYTNITGESLRFIPGTLVLLSHSDPLASYDYGKISGIFLNKRIDETIISTIPAHSDLSMKYTIQVNDSLFNVGNNILLVQYIYVPLNSNDINRNQDLLYGSLFSNEIPFYLK